MDTYWFSRLAEGKADATTGGQIFDPSKIQAKNGGTYEYWLSAIFVWMVPMKGRPAPHNIMTGVWEPSAADAAKGLPEGFGAVTKLLKPEACGKGSAGKTGQIWRDAWMFTSAEFALTKVPVGSATEDATSGADKPDCRGADETPFPGGAWASLPTYFTATYNEAGGSVVRGAKSMRCWGTQTVTDYPVSMVGAYALCANANKGLPADMAKDNTKAVAAIDAAVAKRKLAGTAAIVAMKCRVDAAKLNSKASGFQSVTSSRRGASRLCKDNEACEKAAVKTGRLANGNQGSIPDLKALAACPTNAECLRAADFATNRAVARKNCYLLDNTAAKAQDKKALA